MHIAAGDIVLLAHAGFGLLGSLCAVWVFVEALNARAENAARIRNAAFAVAIFIGLTWVFGGYWYVTFYPVDKAMIVKGPWPFAHNLFMETKEHLFFATGILALCLPVAASGKLHVNTAARRMVLCVALLIALTGMAIEGAGAVIEHGAKVALQSSTAKGRL